VADVGDDQERGPFREGLRIAFGLPAGLAHRLDPPGAAAFRRAGAVFLLLRDRGEGFRLLGRFAFAPLFRFEDEAAAAVEVHAAGTGRAVAVVEGDGLLEDVGVGVFVRLRGFGVRNAEQVAEADEERLRIGEFRAAGGFPAVDEGDGGGFGVVCGHRTHVTGLDAGNDTNVPVELRAFRQRRLENPWNERTSFTHDAAGRRTLKKLANGSRASFTYDSADRLTNLGNLNGDRSIFRIDACTAKHARSRKMDQSPFTTRPTTAPPGALAAGPPVQNGGVDVIWPIDVERPAGCHCRLARQCPPQQLAQNGLLTGLTPAFQVLVEKPNHHRPQIALRGLQVEAVGASFTMTSSADAPARFRALCSSSDWLTGTVVSAVPCRIGVGGSSYEA